MNAAVPLRYTQAVYSQATGRTYWYFRRHGKRTALPGHPGSAEFMAAYHALVEGSDPAPGGPTGKVVKGSFEALVLAYYESSRFKRLSPKAQRDYRSIFGRFVREHGHRRVKDLRRAHVERFVGAMSDRPGASQTYLKRLRSLLKFAIALGWIDTNPTSGVEAFKVGSIHTWSDEEIARFEARWPSGTPERLALDLLLYTGQRSGDVRKMVWGDIGPTGSIIRVVQQKTGAKLSIPIHRDLAHELAIQDVRHRLEAGHPILFARPGKAWSDAGFRQWLRTAFDAAGLPERCKPHGLRKAAARRLAEAGCTANQIMAITGHTTMAEVERYTRAADQERLGREAMGKVKGRGKRT
jgi:integrase